MVTPYDWQEAVSHRAGYIESRLSGGAPVIAASHRDGIVIVTVRRQAQKIYEIYDRLVFAGLGQQSDVEQLRVTAIDFAHQEGFQRSEEDVSIQRVVMALSQPMKRAFGDFNTAPFVARSLFAEVGSGPEKDRFFLLDYDGDYSIRGGWALLHGGRTLEPEIVDRMQAAVKPNGKVEAVVKALQDVWASLVGGGEKTFAELTENLQPETVLMMRTGFDTNRFRVL